MQYLRRREGELHEVAMRNKEGSSLTSRPSGASAESDRLVAMERPAEESQLLSEPMRESLDFWWKSKMA